MARFAQKIEAILVGTVFSVNLVISGHCHVDLALVVEQALLVLLVYSSRGRAVKLRSVLVPQIGIFFLFLVDRCLASVDDVKIDLAQTLSSSDSLREVLCRPLLLKVLNLLPDVIGNIIGCSEGVENLG